MLKENLVKELRELEGQEKSFSDVAYELQQMGFENINDNGYDFQDLLEDGVVYFAFVEAIDGENEDLDGAKARLEFDVTVENGEDEDVTASYIKVTSCTLEEF